VPGNLLTTIKHGVTRYRITLDCYRAEYVSGKSKGCARWMKIQALSDLPLSTTGRQIARLVQQEKELPKSARTTQRERIATLVFSND
jgi:A/G-specific adenine glycosylase